MNWKATTAVTAVTTLGGWLMNSWLWTATPATGTVPERGTAREMTEIIREAERLHRNISTVAPFEQPRRNPFRFSARPAPSVRPEPAPVPPPPLPDPRLLLPPVSLTAIALDVVDGVPQHRAFLSTPQGLVVAKQGDVVGDYRVQAISDDGVELVSTRDESVRRIPVR